MLSFNTVAKEHKKTTNHIQISSKQVKQVKQVKHLKQVKKPKHLINFVGTASWYTYQTGNKTNKTASGERFNPNEYTAAHRSLPFGTKVKVTNMNNNKSVIVTINDRGPILRSRVIDVSHGAAKRLGFVQLGTTKVKLDYSG